MASPILDREHLARYTAGDRALEVELFSLLSKQIESCLEILKETQDPKRWAEAAHTLKGASRGVGAMALGEACAAAEKNPLDHESYKAIENAAFAACTVMGESEF